MQVQINGEWINFPSSLHEITLGQRLKFHEQYGKQLDEMMKSIIEMPDGDEKDIEVLQFNLEQMYKTFAFFANCTEEAVKENEFIDKIAAIYHTCLSKMFDESESIELESEFEWNGEIWTISHPEIKNGHSMTFGEFLDAKQVVQNMVGLSKNRLECLVPLSAIFFRKKGEAYNQAFLYDDSERQQLMLNLPLDYAMQVGFFLKDALNMYIKASQSLENQESNQLDKQ